MKIFEIILILTIISYCVTETDDDCSKKFDQLLEEKCKAIGSCTYSPNDNINFCKETHICDSGSGQTNCTRIVPLNFHIEKCIEESPTKCKESPKTCNDYNKIGGINNRNNGDDCSQLSADDKFYCLYNSASDTCRPEYEKCSDIPTPSTNDDCTSHTPKLHSQKCEIGVNEDGNNICKVIDRFCNDALYKDKSNCFVLKSANSDMQCIFDGNNCIEEYKSCDLIYTGGDENICKYYSPLNSEKNDYDYKKICAHDTSITTSVKCKAVSRKCESYNVPINVPIELINETFCSELEVSNDYKYCTYDGTGCKEMYKNCDDFTSKKVETDRNQCENNIPENKNEKCVYDEIEDKCLTKTIYTNCTAYPGKDKKICESILSSVNNKYCILDKDSECIEKPINCSEAYSEEDCLHIAKSSDSNKRCVWGNPKRSLSYGGTKSCYEEFLRCEDYIAKSDFGAQNCEYIKLYDGKICDSISGNTNSIDRCVSKFKTCTQATTEEECKLIAKTGVTNPERKVCDWIPSGQNTGECIENYKYCSDYRGNDDNNYCTRIKPYDASGNDIDYGFRCRYDSDIGCYKSPVECIDANNEVECASFSDYIIDKQKQHCVFIGNGCTAQYRQCEFVDLDKVDSKCSSNIIEGYIINACTIGSNGKCEKAGNRCSSFKNPITTSSSNYMNDYYIGLCRSINHTCQYDSGKCIFSPKECKDIKFYSNDTDKNKEYCENLHVDKPYKKCVLKEDFSGCKEVYIETDYSTANTSYATPPDASTQGNSSGFIVKGIHIIMALFFLLI